MQQSASSIWDGNHQRCLGPKLEAMLWCWRNYFTGPAFYTCRWHKMTQIWIWYSPISRITIVNYDLWLTISHVIWFLSLVTQMSKDSDLPLERLWAVIVRGRTWSFAAMPFCVLGWTCSHQSMRRRLKLRLGFPVRCNMGESMKSKKVGFQAI